MSDHEEILAGGNINGGRRNMGIKNNGGSTSMNIKKATTSDLDDVTHLALKLWPDNFWGILRPEFEQLNESEDNIVYVAVVEGACVGFIHLSIRHDYVEGSSSSPVGYVEAIYVEEKIQEPRISESISADR